MLRTLLASLVVLTGCASIPTPQHHKYPRLQEPARSNFVVMCVMQGRLPVTACLCFEELLVKMKGTDTSKVTQLDMAVVQQKCMQILQPIMDKELEELMRKAAEEERKESI